jgi:putative salt-induced outer membrane protein
MRRSVRGCAIFTFAITVSAASLAAQQDTVPKPVKLTGDVGFVNTSGNTDVTTLNVGERVDYTLSSRWTLSQTFAVVYGRTNDSTNASTWRAGARADYATTKRFGAYARVDFLRNVFASIERRFDEGVGLAYKVLSQPRDTINFEGGVSQVQQHFTAGTSDNFAAGRAAGTYRHMFTDKASFFQSVEFLPSLEKGSDFLLNTESTLVAPLSKSLAIKLSYVIQFNNLPQPGRKKADRMFTSGLQITL